MKHIRNHYRIIGGHWRSRSLAFPDGEGLRPTSGRIRETLFNWLQLHIAGARCLDLFAGSGALGFEALSRGAASVTALELSPGASAALRRNAGTLPTRDYHLIPGDALQWLEEAREGPQRHPFDIVFLDPPYRSGCLERCCRLLEDKGWLASPALIYLEDDEPLDRLALPGNWRLEKNKKAGRVCYGLCRREA